MRNPRTSSTGSQAAPADQAASTAPAPNVTVDAGAPTDPLIRTETEQLREDALAGGRQAGEGAGQDLTRSLDGPSTDAPGGQQSAPPASDAPVTGLGGAPAGAAPGLSPVDVRITREQAENLRSDILGIRRDYQSAIADAGAIAAPNFSKIGDPTAILVDIEGVAGLFVELERPVSRAAASGTLFFFDREGRELQASVSPADTDGAFVSLLVLAAGAPRPSSYSDGLLRPSGGFEERASRTLVELPAADRTLAGDVADAVRPAAPALQPTAVVDPAFVRVALSGRVQKSDGHVFVVNSEIRAEPDHFYGVRYVDALGVPRIRRLEAFVGPTNSFVMAGDEVAPPIVGSDVQLGVLSAPVDIETGARLTPEGYLALRPLADGTAIAVTVDGRKVRVGWV